MKNYLFFLLILTSNVFAEGSYLDSPEYKKIKEEVLDAEISLNVGILLRLQSSASIKNYLEDMSKENPDISIDALLNRAYLQTMHKAAHQFETSTGIDYELEDTKDFETLTEALQKLSIPTPSGYEDALALKRIRSQHVNAEDFFNEVKIKYGAESKIYQTVFDDSLELKFPNTRENMVFFLKELKKDKKKNKNKIISLLNNQAYDQFSDLIAKDFEFGTIVIVFLDEGMIEDNFLCSHIYQFQKLLKSLAKNPDDTHRDFIYENARQLKTTVTNYVNYGANPNLQCATGKTFSEEMYELTKTALFDKPVHLPSQASASPCVSEVALPKLGALCDSFKVLEALTQILDKNNNSKVSNTTFVETYIDEKCKITILENRLSHSKQVRAKIDVKGPVDYSLSGEDKEDFLKNAKKAFETKSK